MLRFKNFRCARIILDGIAFMHMPSDEPNENVLFLASADVTVIAN